VNLKAVGAHGAIEDTADRVGQRGHFAQAGRGGGDTLGSQAEPVNLALGQPALRGRVEIEGIGLEDLLGALLQRLGGPQQPGVLPRTGRGGQAPGRFPGTPAQFVTVSPDVLDGAIVERNQGNLP
jgi:hypothetical protein